jgi:hypothetical protein
MIWITTSLAAIFLLSQVTLGHTQVNENAPEPLEDSSSGYFVAGLPSLRLNCRDTGKADKDNRWVYCQGEVATFLFRMLGSQHSGVVTTEKKTKKGVRYLHRWSEQEAVACWEQLESNGDPIAIVLYGCAVRS